MILGERIYPHGKAYRLKQQSKPLKDGNVSLRVLQLLETDSAWKLGKTKFPHSFLFLFQHTFCIREIFSFFLFLETFHIQEIFPFPGSRNFWSRRWRWFTCCTRYGKCLETGETKNFLEYGGGGHWKRKVSWNRRNTKIPFDEKTLITRGTEQHFRFSFRNSCCDIRKTPPKAMEWLSPHPSPTDNVLSFL